MIKIDRDALIERYLTQYAEILFHTLNKEDPCHPDVNYYRRLYRLTRMHHAQQGSWLTEEETLAVIHEACCMVAHRFLIEESVPAVIQPSELYNMLVPILKTSRYAR